MSRTTIALVTCFIVLIVLSVTHMIKIFNYELEKERLENECVTRYITLGIERRDIFTGNGECWIDHGS